MSKVICFYHSVDNDGKSSVSIVKKRYPDLIAYGVDYKDNITNLEQFDINRDDLIFIVDFSFEPELMIELNKNYNCIFLDHHITAIEKSIKYGYDNMKGIRDIKKAGCELTWEYLFNNIKTPRAVSLIGRYDVWDHNKLPNIVEFERGLKLYNTNPNNISFWNKLLNNDSNSDIFINKIIDKGITILKYENIKLSNTIKYKAWTRIFNNYKCLISNSELINFSPIYYSLKNIDIDHDIMITITYDGRLQKWLVSLRTDKENVDILSIAEKFGGGGHRGAAGFSVESLPKELL